MFTGSKPRIVEINDIPVEAEVGDHMLFVTNQDKPGFIGKIGSTLGYAGINIATFHLGRSVAGADSICLMQVDQEISEDTLGEVKNIPHVTRAEALNF